MAYDYGAIWIFWLSINSYSIDEIYEDGLAEGERRGLADGEKRGIAGMLDLLKELGCSANDAKLHLKNKLHLSEDTANEYIQKCWNTK